MCMGILAAQPRVMESCYNVSVGTPTVECFNKFYLACSMRVPGVSTFQSPWVIQVFEGNVENVLIAF